MIYNSFERSVFTFVDQSHFDLWSTVIKHYITDTFYRHCTRYVMLHLISRYEILCLSSFHPTVCPSASPVCLSVPHTHTHTHTPSSRWRWGLSFKHSWWGAARHTHTHTEGHQVVFDSTCVVLPVPLSFTVSHIIHASHLLCAALWVQIIRCDKERY